MLSVILYGRNDGHGYNYHKRLAISLNCIASLLRRRDDEILFVDDQTEEGLPTIVEAVADTLTQEAKERIRLLRVRKKNRISPPDTLLQREAVVRNIALRASNPKNRWILSTNGDMIFVPVNRKESLSSLTEHLEERLYLLPRFEIPEKLWESAFHRSNPAETILFLHQNGSALQLNTTVRRKGFLTYDNPGAFQLMPRKTLIEIGGFDETMTPSHHVGANLCKRLYLYYDGTVSTLEESLRGYHCNHGGPSARKYRSKGGGENSRHGFVEEIRSPYIPAQKGDGERTESIALDTTHPLLLRKRPDRPDDILIAEETFNTLTYSPRRIFPYLYDRLIALNPATKIGYFGYNETVAENLPPLTLLRSGSEHSDHEILTSAEVLLFDFGFDEISLPDPPVTPVHPFYPLLRKKLKKVVRTFLKAVATEKRGRRGVECIAINAGYTDFRSLLTRHLDLEPNSLLPGIYAGRIRIRPSGKKTTKMRIPFFLNYVALRLPYHHTDRIRNAGPWRRPTP
ncbi:MAG: hypothetical protein OXF02_01985 [Simkaniaceae bacterium]|nr:hypothetical protein [Simkaniaceae bacterium]